MDIITYFQQNGGYSYLKDLKNAGFQTREVARLMQKGMIEKIKPGLYRLSALSGRDETNLSLVDVCRAIPQGVICLLSALAFYDLTTFNPSQIHVAIPHTSKPAKIKYPPVKIYYFRERFYKPGIEEKHSSSGIVKIYHQEKTVCDMFRYRHKLGDDVALEALKNYLEQSDANINRLRKYAEICQVKTILLPYLKALLV